MAFKRCTACKNDLPADKETFHKNARNKDGLQNKCIKCTLEYAKNQRTTATTYPPNTDPTIIKRCAGPCKRELLATIDNFHRQAKRTDGLQGTCITCAIKRAKDYYAANPEIPSRADGYEAARSRDRRADPAKYLLERHQTKANYRVLRTAVLTAYSGDDLRCACCGERHYEFLALDHVDGGGGKHRKAVPVGFKYWRSFIENNFPPGYRVLCHNCNCARGFYGECPHERERRTVESG